MSKLKIIGCSEKNGAISITYAQPGMIGSRLMSGVSETNFDVSLKYAESSVGDETDGCIRQMKVKGFRTGMSYDIQKRKLVDGGKEQFTRKIIVKLGDESWVEAASHYNGRGEGKDARPVALELADPIADAKVEVNSLPAEADITS